MNLEGIINISGKAGLFKIISKNKNTIIVESLADKKRSPLHSYNNANLLEEIGIYTYSDTKSLSEIINDIAKKENGKKTLSHKSSQKKLTDYFREIVADYDEQRVYNSDIKKVIQWYNIMQENGLIKIEKKEKPKTKKS
tara:strand:+ start:45 stop:461 length:417 start_codon:yes stop_codon:yes gene_type:complete